jgi:hypothetical protein
MGTSDKGWNEHQLLVLHELKRLADRVETVILVQQQQSLALEAVKLKTSFIATISGFISAAGFNVGKLFFER